MEKVKGSTLEPLLKFQGSFDPNSISSDAAVLSCGCIVSERYFSSLINPTGMADCPDCLTHNVSLLKPIKQLRDLYGILTRIQADSSQQSVAKSRRRSSSKKSFRGDSVDRTSEQMDLISLFYKYAKEENTHPDIVSSITTPLVNVEPIEINQSRGSSGSLLNSLSISPLKNVSPLNNSVGGGTIIGGTGTSSGGGESQPFEIFHERTKSKTSKFEEGLWSNLSEEKEYNFSKCFPFHRKLSTFQTQQGKLFSANLFKGSMIKKTPRFISSDINIYIDPITGKEVTRFVLITDKRWELYEVIDESDPRPILVCCGKLSGEYGALFNEMKEDYGQEVVIRNDFSNSQSNDQNSNIDHKKKLNQWEQLNCRLSPSFLVISGTKGIMRVFNVSKSNLPHEMGKPVYTYITNFPIRCLAISNTDPLIACGITAKERISGKEQPFVVLHKLVRSNIGDKIIGSVEPITITIPYRDPIKLMNFNATSTHLMCCTVWESRYLIIRLRSPGSDNYKKPRLIWTDSSALRLSKRKKSDGVFYDDSDDDNSEDDALMMDNEGITDVHFGAIPNTIVLTSCSLQLRPPIMLRLEGSSIDSFQSRQMSDTFSLDSSMNSRHDAIDDEQDITNIKSSDLLLRFLEVGFSIHKVAILPRRDALAFLDKDGKIYLVSIPNYELHLNSGFKKVVVLLGEVSNAERYIEAASIKFSADGGKVYVADRKGLFLIFDFTKGVPGQDADVVKCKIINV